MKKTVYLLSLVLLTGLFITSCEKEEGLDKATKDEVAADMASSMGESNSGVTSEISSAALLTGGYNDPAKSQTNDTVYSVENDFTLTNPHGTLVTYSFSFHVEYGFVLQNYILHHAYYNSDISGSFDGPRIASSENRTNNWVFTGLLSTTGEYILNGQSERSGNSQSKVGNQSQITSNASITFSDVLIDKLTSEIVGGTLFWEIEGTVNDKSFACEATVVYKGDGLAELTIEGDTYTVDLTTGEIEE